MTYRSLFGSAFAGLALLAAAPAGAADFYAGKQIHMIVGADAGGVYDIYARLVARHIGDHIPGSPSIVVQNMPGTGSIKMAGYMFAAAPRDGLTIGSSFGSVPTSPLTSPNEATYDPTAFSWIGNATKELYVGYVWSTLPVKTFTDTKTTPVIMGGSAVGTFSIDMAVLANAFFDTKFRIITGYKSGPDTQMAVEKGEVEGVMGTAWNSVKQKKDWIDNKKIRVIVQYGLTRDAQFPDVELFYDSAKTDEQRQAIKFMIGNLVHGKPFFAPPQVPADRLAILRKAFDDTMKDPGFLADVKAANVDLNEPMGGEALAKLVAEEAHTPRAVVDNISAVIDKFKKDAH